MRSDRGQEAPQNRNRRTGPGDDPHTGGQDLLEELVQYERHPENECQAIGTCWPEKNRTDNQFLTEREAPTCRKTAPAHWLSKARHFDASDHDRGCGYHSGPSCPQNIHGLWTSVKGGDGVAGHYQVYRPAPTGRPDYGRPTSARNNRSSDRSRRAASGISNFTLVTP